MVHAYLFSSVVTWTISTKYKDFTIQCRRARIINFSIIVDFEFKIFSDTTLIEMKQEIIVRHLPFGWMRTGGFELYE